MDYIIPILLGYLLGSSNLAYYISLYQKKDIRANGTGNLGASNATVLLGWKAGVSVALHDIGKAFMDTVEARTGGHKCQIKVTSVLRTDNSIKRLKKRNVNATEASCHIYGTTFDISWIRFNYCDPNYIMYTEDLKNVLAEILYKMREQGRCYIKFERKQSCFHITTRGK